MNETQAKQVEMHTNFFDRCREAITNQYYLEAIFMEYAAIEGRLEAILGIIGEPCNKNLSKEIRRRINISHRLECLNRARKGMPVFEHTKLPWNFFTGKSAFAKWISKRNQYIHGLFKSETDYSSRIAGAKRLAEEGFEICRLLYNEAKRLNRLRKSHPELFENISLCDKLCTEK